LEDYSTIEIRHPFFDRRLLEFCLAIPAGQKMKNGVTRYILHRAMDGIIPEEINKRSDKGNISSNFLKYFAIHGKARINEILSAKSGGVSDLLNIRKVTELYCQFEQDPLKSEQAAIFLFPMLTLDQWLRGLPR
jgi:asparagine synthase (glutamine-hydrolysing)